MEQREDSLCLVTAFMDIGRGEWQTFTRSVKEYIASFMPYLNLNHDLIVFIDQTYSSSLQWILEKDPPVANVKIIPIDREWMNTNIRAYSKLEMEGKIMESQNYNGIIGHRKHCPECSHPEYNIMQHAKIDFVCYAIENELSKASHFAWTDFGYFKSSAMLNPKGTNKLDLGRFDLDRINFQTINPIEDRDQQTMYTLQCAPEKIGGFFYLGSRDLLLSYQKLYHQVNDEFHRMGLVDDDQHFMIKCYFRRKDMFKLWDLNGWHKIYTTFCV